MTSILLLGKSALDRLGNAYRCKFPSLPSLGYEQITLLKMTVALVQIDRGRRPIRCKRGVGRTAADRPIGRLPPRGGHPR